MAIELIGHVIDRQTARGLANLHVEAWGLALDSHEPIGRADTDADGNFRLSWEARALARLFRDRPVEVFFKVFSRDGNTLLASTEDSVVWRRENPRAELVIEVNASAAVEPRPAAVTLESLNSTLNLNIRPDLLANLGSRNIHTLSDVLHAGGIANLGELPPGSEPLLHTLDAHANLSVVSPIPQVNAKLIEAGFTSLRDIADLPRVSFLAKVGDHIDRETAENIHATADVQVRLLTNALTDLRLRALTDEFESTASPFAKLFPKTCGCPNCRNAASPIAYLADLLDYAIRHLKHNGNPVTLTFLEQRFHQPFRNLPATCEALDEKVRQVRICIEVLRGFLPAPYNAQTPQRYLEAAYLKLLEQIGTSFEELRRSRTQKPRDRVELAERLQVLFDLHPGGTRLLDEFFRDPSAPATSNAVTERWLHDFFGLRDTTSAPLDPDPRPAILNWRLDYWYHKWEQADWATDTSKATLGVYPFIDPDVIGEPDLKDLKSISGADRTKWTAYDFLKHRRAWIGTTTTELNDARVRLGLPDLLTELQKPNMIPDVGPSVMTGILVPELLTQRAQARQGQDISAWLQQVDLSAEEFEALGHVAELDQQGQPILKTEWEDLNSIIIQRAKKQVLYAEWRREEAATNGPSPAGFTNLSLTSRHFKLRPQVLADSQLAWRPTRFRSTEAMRQKWEDTLRARIEQEEAVREGVKAAINAVEETLLTELRNELLRTAAVLGLLGPSSRPDGMTWFTRHFQIDCEADACQMTTRIAQATQTIQGVLFGARTALLEDTSLTLDADHFDEEWQWIGSYATWRAAMQVFLYPENALRPALRGRQSPAFKQLVTNLRMQDRVDSEIVRKEVAEYEKYFSDVCSLVLAGLRQTAGLLSQAADKARSQNTVEPWWGTGDVLAVGQAIASGGFYTSTWVRQPGWGLSGSPGQTLWQPITQLADSSDLVGLVPYQGVQDRTHIALYFRSRKGESYQYQVAHHDGAEMSPANSVGELPTLICTSQYTQGTIPPSPNLAEKKAGPWELHPKDQMIAADLDGDGRSEIVAISGALGADGRRRLGVLREWGGGLRLDWEGWIEGTWRVPDPERPVLFRVALNTFPWQNQRLLIVNTSGPLLATLGWVNGSLEVINATSVVPGPTGNWSVNLGSPDDPTVFLVADLDGSGQKLVVFEHQTVPIPGTPQTTVQTVAHVMRWQNEAFVLMASPSLGFNIMTSINGSPTEFPWQGLLPVRSGFSFAGSFSSKDREDILVVGRRTFATTFPGETGTVLFVGLLRWDDNTQEFPSVPSVLYWGPTAGTLIGDPEEIPGFGGQPGWALLPDDEFYPFETGEASQVILIRSPSRSLIGVLGYQAGGKLGVLWQTTTQIQAENTQVQPWLLDASDRFFAADIDGDGRSELLVTRGGGTSHFAVLVVRPDHSVVVRWRPAGKVVSFPRAGSLDGWILASTSRYLTADLDDDGYLELAALAVDGGGPRIGVLRSVPDPVPRRLQGLPSRFGPVGVKTTDISKALSDSSEIREAYDANFTGTIHDPAQNLFYLDEAYYFVPIEVALRLYKSGNYTAALDWFRLVYDYNQPPDKRKTAYKLVLDSRVPTFDRATDWLRDPLDPHAIAETRKNSYTKFTILAIARCLVDDADGEFTRATSESLPRARELYLKALELLDAPELKQHQNDCSDLIGTLEIKVGSDEEIWLWHDIGNELRKVSDYQKLQAAVQRLRPVLTSATPFPERHAAARKIAAEALDDVLQVPTFETVLARTSEVVRNADKTLLAESAMFVSLDGVRRSRLSERMNLGELDGWPISWGNTRDYIPAPALPLCIPFNPAIEAARRHAELNLHKLRTCRNIAGLHVNIEPYVTPTATESSLTSVDTGDQLLTLRPRNLKPLPYRYATLIERTKQLVELARQMESSMLQFISSADQARYQELKARQDLALAWAGVRLKDLQLTQATDGVTNAELQRDRAQIQVNHYSDILSAGLILNETLGLLHLGGAAVHQHAAAAFEWGQFVGKVILAIATEGASAVVNPPSLSQAVSSTASALSLTAQLHNRFAELERREEGWRFEKQLAEQDVRIGQQQIRLAQDQELVVGQERVISELQAEQAGTILDFLTTKRFTNADLYDWMSTVIEGVYRFFLQQATAMAQLAEAQLKFERQELLPAFIKEDYWEPPSQGQSPDFSPPSVSGQATNLHGLTGSARLLRDVFELDQYAFRTNQRKLQLTDTLSLGQLDPFAFQRFRETGVLPFATPTELFDRKFPGNYLRLIRRVRTSVIALIPPSLGIRATLSTVGTSYTVIGTDTFPRVRIQRGPETVALTSPINATGVFELDTQPELLIPFEGIGVDTVWEFRMPKAANLFDYNSIADVLVTIEYTALHSFDYRQQVLENLDRFMSADRAFSFRQQFADAWYDLHNPELVAPPDHPMVVAFQIQREDFPPNLEDLSIKQVALYFAPAKGNLPKKVHLRHLFLNQTAGTPAPDNPTEADNAGIISSRRGWNAPKGDPVGTWELALLDDTDTRAFFKNEEIEDILFVITYSARIPNWPS